MTTYDTTVRNFTVSTGERFVAATVTATNGAVTAIGEKTLPIGDQLIAVVAEDAVNVACLQAGAMLAAAMSAMNFDADAE